MIPARMGSQRLKRKNLRLLQGVPLITRAIRKCREAEVFDEIWVNSENEAFAEFALAEGVLFHQRPAALGDNTATSEQFVFEFLQHHPGEYLFQVHSIAPLLTADEVADFVNGMVSSDCDVYLSVVEELIECAYRGQPVNFKYGEKTNSQDLDPIQRITWSITGWRVAPFVEAAKAERCATYAGRIGFHPINRVAGHIIKTESDLRMAEALLPWLEEQGRQK